MLGRPSPWAAITVALACAAVTLAGAVDSALASSFQRDRTPLPPSVSSGGGRGAAHTAQASSGGSAIVRMVVGLAIVVAVIYGVYWLLRAYGRSRGLASDGRLAVVATTSLAQNRALHLVRVGDELVLVGSAEHAVTPIRVYTPDEVKRLESFFGDPERSPASDRRDGRASAGGGAARFVDHLRRASARQ